MSETVIRMTPLLLLTILISAILGELFLGKWGAFIGVGVFLVIWFLISLIFGWVRIKNSFNGDKPT